MRGSIAPYAVGAVLVVVLSTAALAAALAAGGLLEPRAAPDPTPSPAGSRGPIELSRSGRLAYWRVDPNGTGFQLWVANIDGTNRRALARADLISGVEAVRWSPDGNAIAYVDRGQQVVVVRLDGGRAELTLDAIVAAGGARFTELAWSTDGRFLAGTLRDGLSQRTDVWVAPSTGGVWRNVTALGSAFLSQWISASELLIHTRAGLIAVQRADGNGLVPLTGLVATSPFVGDDGRVYFLAGQVAPTVRDVTVPVINAAQARVWSTTVDGGDVRQELPQLYDDVRLVTRWSPGRYVAQQGASTALAFLGTGQPPFATLSGVVDRIVFSPDRRTAIGLSASRIYRYDTAQPESPVVLLSDVAQPDAWYPTTVTLARASQTPPPARPVARYAFALHGLVWATDAQGVPHRVATLDADDRSLRRLSGSAIPQWSPRGDRILYFDVLGNSFAGAAFVADPAGSSLRLGEAQIAQAPFPTWTPGGEVAYAILPGSRDSAGFGDAAELRIALPGSGGVIARYAGREAAFGSGKTYLIDNGQLSVPLQTRTAHVVVEATGATSRRTVATAAQLAAVEPGAVASSLQLSALGISADGGTLSARVSPAVGSGSFLYVFFRAADGKPTLVLPGPSVSDVRWSPKGHLVGMTIGRPIVRDAETGVIVTTAGEGRFAGWSPDGAWFYVARDTGLYAIPLAGGDPVRISALGVPVSTTP